MAKYNFFCRGGVDQLRIETPDDLAAIETLDPKLWVALSMPAVGQELDPDTLSLLDGDGDKRIRVAEIISAVKFVRENLADFSAFFESKDAFPLSAIAENSPILTTAKSVLSRIEKNYTTEISLADVKSATASFDKQAFNGDDVLIPECAGDDTAVSEFITDAVAATGGTADASGEQGITAAQARDFIKSANAVITWRAASADDATILPLGAGTDDAFTAFSKVRTKIDDFFARTRLASFDATAAAKLNPSDTDFAALAVEEISSDVSLAFPLARIVAVDGEPVLPLVSGINPAWAGALASFVEKTVVPAFEIAAPETLTATQWAKLCALFAPYEKWLGDKPAGGADAFPQERLAEIVAGDFEAKLTPIFEKDAAEKPLRAALIEAERLCRYSRDLAKILRNFVSFAEFYKRSATDTAFLVGRLFMDCRTCSLCVRVDNATAHSALAAKSNCCLVYCDCVRKGGSEKMTIAAMFGDGDSLALYVGRNGVFYDKKGEDWDAKIVKIIENPISIRQAFWAPYRKVAKFIETQVENFASTREKKADNNLNSSTSAVLTKATSAPAPGTTAPKTAFDVAKFAGIFAAISLALGAIGAALSVAISGFFALAPWQMVLVVLGIILLISSPSMLIAAMKLRHRSLGPILEANGWAINGNVKINIPLGKAFTEMPKKPEGSKTSRRDPYRKKAFPWGKILVAFAVFGTAGAIIFYLTEKPPKNSVPAQISAPGEKSSAANASPPPPQTPLPK